jgi:hypothetical protein
MHSTDDLEDGYFGSGSLLSRSIKKHGKEKHQKEILEFLPTREALKLREKEIVNEEMLGDKKCMNLQLGGEGGFSEETRLAGNRAFSAMIASDTEFRADFCKKAKIASQLGQAALSLKYPNGVFSGKNHISETRRQMSETHKERGNHIGKKNSQFGTCWVKKDAVSIKIQTHELNEYLQRGYLKGRTMSNKNFPVAVAARPSELRIVLR